VSASSKIKENKKTRARKKEGKESKVKKERSNIYWRFRAKLKVFRHV
jgi:hypothetical protein